MVLGAAGTAAMLARASAPAAPRKLVSYADTEDIFEMTERELWGEDTGEVLHASASAPSLGFDLSYSTDSDEDESCESPSPDIKAFHGESLSQPEQDLTSDSTAAQPADQPATQHSSNSTAERLQQPNTGQASTDSAPAAVDDAVQPFTARRSTDSNPRRSTDSTARQSFESASAVPISGLQRSRRPPLRANSTFANRDGMRNPRAAIKMGSSAPINIPLMSRISLKGDDDDSKKPAPFVPPHLISNSEDPVMQQQQSIFTGESLGASVKREKLQQRNAILRRTGFLEGSPRMKGVAEVMDPIKESHLEIDTLHSNSALTAALGSSPSVGNAAV